MTEEFNPPEYSINPDDYNAYIQRLKEEQPGEIDKILTRYISYEPEMVEAALYVAVEKGLITYDLKERLTSQIRMNFSKKAKAAKQANWENYNAFTGYIDKYIDEDIHNLIEDPSDIVIDVYHAVLLTAKERRLITGRDFEKMYNDALNTARSDEELLKEDLEEFREYQGNNAAAENEENEEEIETREELMEIERINRRTGKRVNFLLLRYGIVLMIAGIMMLFVYFKLILQKESVEIVIPIVAVFALGLGVLLLWLFAKSRKANKEKQDLSS